MSKKNPIVSDTITIDTQDELDRIAQANRRRKAEIERDQQRKAERANSARQRLAANPGGDQALQRVEKIIDGNPDPETIELAAQMQTAERGAEGFCERYLLDAGKLSEALHLTTPMLAELQKLAFDALHTCAAWFMGTDGVAPQGDTHNLDDRNLLTAPVCYASSWPGERWVIGPSQSFDDVVELLATDCHCDLSVEPYAKKLAPFYVVGGCVKEMAEQVADRNKLLGYAAEYPNDKKFAEVASNIRIGNLFPVAFGNQVVFLKFCTGHALALAAKYQIQIRQCGIFESWEGPGNYW